MTLSSKYSIPFFQTGHLQLFLLLLLSYTAINTITTVSAQETEGWSDALKLGYTYDALDGQLVGPDKWGDIATAGTGEWDIVKQNTIDNNFGEEVITDAITINQCGTEERPSHIELIPSATCEDTQEMVVRQYRPDVDCLHPFDVAEMTMAGGDDSDAAAATTGPWELTPYSLRYYYPRSMINTCRAPTVRLDGIMANIDRRNLQEHFVLQWMELHARSEHVIQGRRYDAELQMIHRSTTLPNELVVVSVLIDASQSGAEDHSDFQNYLLNGWQQKHLEEEQACAKRGLLERDQRHLRGKLRKTPGYMTVLQDYDSSVKQMNMTDLFYKDDDDNDDDDDDIATTRQERQRQLQKCTTDAYGNGCAEQGLAPRRRLFPYNLWPSVWYFSYQGSLTAPPCAGNVHWRIIDTPLYVLFPVFFCLL